MVLIERGVRWCVCVCFFKSFTFKNKETKQKRNKPKKKNTKTKTRKKQSHTQKKWQNKTLKLLTYQKNVLQNVWIVQCLDVFLIKMTRLLYHIFVHQR